MIANPPNFISRRLWKETDAQPLLASIDSSDDRFASALDLIYRRNEELMLEPSEAEFANRELLLLLDTAASDDYLEELSTQCLDMIEDRGLLLNEVLEWSTCLYRQGLSRIYIAANLLRRWNSLGIDTDGAILDFLAKSAMITCHKPSVYILVSELVRSKHFSVGRYLQWLIARGALDRVKVLQPVRVDSSVLFHWKKVLTGAQTDPCDVRLLAELPASGLPLPLVNLRRMLLKRVGLSTAAELEVSERAKAAMALIFSGENTTGLSGSVERSLHRFRAQHWAAYHSRSMASEISQWICQSVKPQLDKGNLFVSHLCILCSALC
jgi:mediator of RNA polymerase II transcription subunit 12